MKKKLPVLVESSVAQARVLRDGLGQTLKIGIGEKATCRKGCAHCCYHPVVASILEGVLLYKKLKDSGLWTPSFKQKLEAHFALVVGLEPEIWTTSGIPCPLLTEQRTCSAYEARPILCQTMISLGDPEACTPSRFSIFGPLANRQAEITTYYKKEKKLLKSLGLAHNRLPISLAVLLGADLIEWRLDISEVDRQMYLRYAEGDS